MEPIRLTVIPGLIKTILLHRGISVWITHWPSGAAFINIKNVDYVWADDYEIGEIPCVVDEKIGLYLSQVTDSGDSQ